MSDQEEHAAAATAKQRLALHEKLRHGPTTLYDRQDHVRQLHEAYHRALHERPLQRVALVSGKAGTGKSKLVLEFLEQVRRENNETIILQGKFDQLQQSSSAQDTIAAAFAQVSQSLKEDHELRARVEEAVGLDASLLLQTIPGLAGSLTIPHTSGVEEFTTGDVAAVKAQKRAAFLKFVRTLSSPTKPVVLFIDDLQWANPGDFGVLTSILLDEKITGLFLVFACRNVAIEHRLSIFLQSLASQIEIQDIVVGNLSLEAVSEYLSELLGEQDCTTLARSIFSRTAGNSFFLKELLATLLEEKQLIWREGSWCWDADEMAVRKYDQDVLSFIAYKLKQLPMEMQDLLKAAACLGSTFGIDTLQNLVKPNKEQRLDELLRRCQETGLLVRKASMSSTWSFSHDRIQQASYDLIPETERAAFHLSIGRALRDRMDEDRLKAMMPVVANQFCLCHGLIASHDERIHTAVLLLRAGKQQARMSNFDAAGSFFNTSLNLLGEDCWTSCYDLSLEIYNASAEVSYVLADFERLDKFTDTVCKNAKTFDDTVQIRTTHVYCLGARNMLHDAVEEGLAVLKKLDEPIPRSISSLRLFVEYYKTNMKLSRLSERNILNLSEMTDPKKLAALRLMNLLFHYMYWKGDYKQSLFWLMRSVQLTLQHGLCGMSAIGLAINAGIICAAGKIEKGYVMGRVAVSVVEKFNAKEWAGRVMVVASAFVYPWKIPPRELSGNFETASQSCFETGDIEFALLARTLLVGALFSSTERDLGYVLGVCRSLFGQMHQYKQDALLSMFVPSMQLIANLAGQSESVTILTGAFMDEREVMNRSSLDRDSMALQVMHVSKLTLATFVWDFELARDQLRKFERLKHKNDMYQQAVLMELFYGGITLLSTDRPEVRKAKGKLRRLESLCRHAPSLYAGKICLLEAELAAAEGNTTKAMEKFHTSIALSQRQMVWHEQALACERMFLFLKKVGKMKEAIDYLNEAKHLYQTWGCVAKVRHIDSFLSSRHAHATPTI